MSDEFSRLPDTESGPSRNCYLITPHATDPVPFVTKAIRADDAGTITFRTLESNADVTLTFAAGEMIPVRVTHVRVAGTTVTKIHGLA
jgi:hypothetical protein